MNTHLCNLQAALEWPPDSIIETPLSIRCMICLNEIHDNFNPIKFNVEGKSFVVAWVSLEKNCKGRKDE
jgi:hypothetical protein